MTGLCRTFGLAVALAAFSAPVFGAPTQDLKETFNQGVELFQRGKNDEALKMFQSALAASPTQEAAYELWKETDYAVWRDLLVQGGEFELVAKRLIELARAGRKARANDAEAIKGLVLKVTGTDTDALERRKSTRQLASDHGEYAVPYLIANLGDGGDADRRELAMVALARMDTDVVPPLCESLGSDDHVMRRNVVLVLGTIGDRRSGGWLLALGQGDKDESVRKAALESAARLKITGDARTAFCALGDAYHYRRDTALGDRAGGEVVWNWKEGKLEALPVPVSMYADEMALKAYSHALAVDPTSTEALAGLARAWISEKMRIDALEKAGQDVGPWKARAESAHALVNSAGVDALNMALAWSVGTSDSSTGAAVCRALGDLCSTPCPALMTAVACNDGAIRSEAAVALGWIGARGAQVPGPQVVAMIGDSAGREVRRMAAVIGDGPVALALAEALDKQGVYVSTWNTGAKGSTMARRAPGLDVIVLAETLPDLTTSQVLDEIKGDERTAGVPVVLLVKDAASGAMYGDKIAGTTTGAGDLASIDAALGKNLEGDRALADDLSKRAAEVLAHLGHGGHCDLTPAIPALTSTLATRPDPVAIPAMHALGSAGGPNEVTALLAVLSDEKRSEDARVGAANAIAAILARLPDALGPNLAQLAAVTGSKAPVAVRDAASRALGRAQMDPAARAELLQKLRG